MKTSEKSRLEGIPHFETFLTELCLDDVANTTISLIKPDWDIKNLEKLSFSEGTSNKIFGFRCIADQQTDDILLFRIYGENTELLLERAWELESFALLTDNGLAPKIFCTFENGFCYEYQPGSTINIIHLQEDKFLRKTAVLIAKLHSVQPNRRSLVKTDGTKARLFDDLKQYCGLLKDNFQLQLKRYYW